MIIINPAGALTGIASGSSDKCFHVSSLLNIDAPHLSDEDDLRQQRPTLIENKWTVFTAAHHKRVIRAPRPIKYPTC